MCKELVRLTTQDVGNVIPVTDSKIISDKLELKHHSITRIIRKYEDDFKMFGKVGFEIQASISGQKEKIYILNEMQYSLLMTYLKNTDKVREYKIKFVKAFFMMKNELQARQETRHIGVQIRKNLTDTIKEKVDNEGNFKKFAYSNYSKLVYKKVLGKTVKKLKEDRGLKEKDNLRNYLTLQELEKVQELESKIASYIEMRKDLNNNDKEIYNEVKIYIESLG